MCTVSEALGEFVEGLAGQSVCNRRNYRQRLSGFVKLCGESRPVVEVRPADVNKWLAVLEGRGLQEATLAGYRQALKAFCNWLVAGGLVAVSPAVHVRVGSFVSRLRRLPVDEEVERVAAVARAWLASGEAGKVRDGVIFLLALTCGCRLREIRELRLSEVAAALAAGPDVVGAFRVVSRGKTKEVLLRFDASVAAGLSTWLSLRPRKAVIDRCFVGLRPSRLKDDPVMLYRPLSRSGATAVFVRLSEAAGLKKAIRCHALRHRLGHRLAGGYGPKVAALALNHKDWATAATATAFYYHPDEGDVSAAVVELSSGVGDGLAASLFGRVKLA